MVCRDSEVWQFSLLMLTYDGDLNSVVELYFPCGGCHNRNVCGGLIEYANCRWVAMEKIQGVRWVDVSSSS